MKVVKFGGMSVPVYSKGPYPCSAVCGSLQPDESMCGDSREQAMRWLGWMEDQTQPE